MLRYSQLGYLNEDYYLRYPLLIELEDTTLDKDVEQGYICASIPEIDVYIGGEDDDTENTILNKLRHEILELYNDLNDTVDNKLGKHLLSMKRYLNILIIPYNK